MSLTQQEVRGIADYARIALTDEELVEMTAYMNDAGQTEGRYFRVPAILGNGGEA